MGQTSDDELMIFKENHYRLSVQLLFGFPLNLSAEGAESYRWNVQNLTSLGFAAPKTYIKPSTLCDSLSL